MICGRFRWMFGRETKIMYIVAVNLLFLVCSLPVVTAGVACSAMYAVLFRYIRGDEPDIVRTFGKEFKNNFGTAKARYDEVARAITKQEA